MPCVGVIWAQKATNLTSETTKTVYTKIWKLFLTNSLIRSLFTPCIQEASRQDRDVNASGNAHPEDKVKADADPSLCFPCLEINVDVTRESDELFPGVSSWGASQLSLWKGCKLQLKITQKEESLFSPLGLLLVIFSLSLIDRRRHNTKDEICIVHSYVVTMLSLHLF